MAALDRKADPMWDDDRHLLKDEDALRALYGPPVEAAIFKEIDHLHPIYRPFVEKATMMVLATRGRRWLDASPRGGPPGFVTVEDTRTLLMPDRPGNNRADTMRNIIHDPRVGLLFFVPGCAETLRINGRAVLSLHPDLMERFAEGGKKPRCVVVVRIETVFIQCSRALKRAGAWDPASQVDRATLPSIADMLEALRPLPETGIPQPAALD
jgi:PPOX class probable FMN-dependent enzyme